MSMMLNISQKMIFSLLLLSLIGCNNAMSKNDNKFEWDATESAPKHYPMEIIRGSFIYKGEKELGLYIPSGGTLKAGWGYPISSHVTGEKYKPLPDRLKITFFSYAEKQFYQGTFELPYDRILELFKQGVAEDPESPMFSGIMAGIAPGGIVSVWVIGRGEYKEVFFGQAEKVDLNPSSAFALPFKDKADSDAYISEGLIEAITQEELDSLNENGIPFGLWSRYRNKYDWVPVIRGGYSREYVNVLYFNGESEDNWTDFEKSENGVLRPVPQHLTFKSVVNGVDTLFKVSFDEMETMAAFEQLSADEQKITVEFDPKRPRSQTTVRLYNDKESIQLTKIISKDW